MAERGREQSTMMKTTCSGIPSPINSSVTLGKLLKHQVLQFPHSYKGNNNRIYLKGFCESYIKVLRTMPGM